jgi:hypothetical protein
MLHFLLHLLHPLRVLWRERIDLFWPIWFATTASGVLLVIWLFPPQREEVPGDSNLSRPPQWSPATILAVVFLSLFLACYIKGMLFWEDFTYYDNSHFTNGTLAGHNIPRQILPEAGRFWPLGHQEFNVLRHFTSSVAGYHAFRIFQLVLLCGILLVFDEKLSFTVRVLLICLALITPGILISFTGLIYPEANVIFFFVCLAWFVKRFEETHSVVWAVAAIVSSQFLLYYKELAFLLLSGFAAGRLLARCWQADRRGWDFKRLRDPESRLDICLGVLAAAFLVFYLAAMFPNYHTRYAEEFRLPLERVLASYMQLDLLVWVFVAVVLGRIYLIARHELAPSPLWEGLALAGIAYFVGYVVLRMSSAYYLAPVDLIAILYLGRLLFLGIQNMSFAVRAIAFAILLLVCVQNLSLSAFRVYERKNVVHAKAELGQAIKARYESDPASAKRLYFPFAEPFHILEFASYLSYIGVPVEQVRGDGSDPASGVLLVGQTIEKNGPCGYRAFLCHPGGTPDRGDLVVILPDDFARSDELRSFRQEGVQPIFSYDPRPSILPWLRPYVSCLHVVSPVLSGRHLPDSWLNASVTAWK